MKTAMMEAVEWCNSQIAEITKAGENLNLNVDILLQHYGLMKSKLIESVLIEKSQMGDSWLDGYNIGECDASEYLESIDGDFDSYYSKTYNNDEK